MIDQSNFDYRREGKWMNNETYASKLVSFQYEMRGTDRSPQEPKIAIRIFPLDVTGETSEGTAQYLGLDLTFCVTYEAYMLSGVLEQVIKHMGPPVESEDDLSNEELSQLVHPLLQEMDQLVQETTSFREERIRRRET